MKAGSRREKREKKRVKKNESNEKQANLGVSHAEYQGVDNGLISWEDKSQKSERLIKKE